MRSGFTGDSDEKAEVQMAPLIDCVFLLLIFFLVAASLKKVHKDLELELPHSAAAIKTKSKHETLIIEMDREGTVHIEMEPVTTKKLHAVLRQKADENPNRRVRIDADRRAAAHYLVHLLDLCQFRGLNDIGVRSRD